jgi:hypothetical protein
VSAYRLSILTDLIENHEVSSYNWLAYVIRGRLNSTDTIVPRLAPKLAISIVPYSSNSIFSAIITPGVHIGRLIQFTVDQIFPILNISPVLSKPGVTS